MKNTSFVRKIVYIIIIGALLIPLSLMAILLKGMGGIALLSALAMLLPWVGAAVYAVLHPHCGLHDRLVGTWVVARWGSGSTPDPASSPSPRETRSPGL